MQTYRQTLNQAKIELKETLQLTLQTAYIEAKVLLKHCLQCEASFLIAHESEYIDSAVLQQFLSLLSRRLSGEPIAYLIGYKEFFGLKIQTTPSALIPRSETETLIEAVVEIFAPNFSGKILDLGTGTGAIAIALAQSFPNASIVATDYSLDSLALAQKNQQWLNLNKVSPLPIQFKWSNWFSAIAKEEKFTLIVSNPPYIAENDVHLNQGDLRFEPKTALISGENGLQALREIISQAPNYLCNNGHIFLEHGYKQAEEVSQLLEKNGFTHIQHYQDLQGILRVVKGIFVTR